MKANNNDELVSVIKRLKIELENEKEYRNKIDLMNKLNIENFESSERRRNIINEQYIT